MNRNIKTMLAALALTPMLTGCLQEYFPTDMATATQIESADKAGISNAIAAYMTNYSLSYTYDIGFPGFMLWRDAMSADLPIVEASWDYFTYYNEQITLGNYTLESTFWSRYYSLVLEANLLLSTTTDETAIQDAPYVGNALCYRALAYLDMARMYEYRLTGVDNLDATARSRGIMGLTVPIVTENTTEAEARNNPRVPFYHIYRFILSDLNRAVEALTQTRTVDSKTNASLGVAYGLQARLWLEMATRFELHADDLALALQHEDDKALADLDKLEISDANAAYRKASKYARLAINEGYTPVTQTQWYDLNSGFNSPNGAWMWCITISPNNSAATDCVWQSWASYMSPECTYGLSSSQYSGGRMIDAALYATIKDGDWRKNTWINPADVANATAYESKYADITSYPYSEWKNYKAYVGFKFRPGSGDGVTSTIGNAVSIPLMRVEEMYLIEAEAEAHCTGAGTGKALLEAFVNGYRWNGQTPYTCEASDTQGVTDEVFRQKRIELWGEGLILWDYTRLEKPIVRGYIGTNHPEKYWFNSYDHRKAPWTIFYIPDSEQHRNGAVVLNPDMSLAIPQWTN